MTWASVPASPFRPGRWAPAPFVPRSEIPARLPLLPEKERAELEFIERQIVAAPDQDG